MSPLPLPGFARSLPASRDWRAARKSEAYCAMGAINAGFERADDAPLIRPTGQRDRVTGDQRGQGEAP